MQSEANASISKYLRHANTTANKHYNFAVSEEAERGRRHILEVTKAPGGAPADDATNKDDTASLTSAETNAFPLEGLTDAELTTNCFDRLQKNKPITVGASEPRMKELLHFT